MKISIVMDNSESWGIPFGKELKRKLEKLRHEVSFYALAREVTRGDVAFFLHCEKIVSRVILLRNKHNVVVHASAVPRGRGWSPLTWQILEGKNDIPVSLFEAAQRVDSGPVYLRDLIHFDGHELIDEMRDALGKKTIELALKFINAYPNVIGKPQGGKATFYARRTPKDSELDMNKPLWALFNQLRVADNRRYPAFFTYSGHTFILRIDKEQRRIQTEEL